MRLVTFVNWLYLGQKQYGLQSAHVLGDMLVKYAHDAKQSAFILDWAANHKTIIIKNGVNSGTVRRIKQQLWLSPYPQALFCEDEESLDGAATACGIIIPNGVAIYADGVRNKEITPALQDQTPSEYDLAPLVFDGHMLTLQDLVLADLMNQYSLA